jgi:hypothetical protein
MHRVASGSVESRECVRREHIRAAKVGNDIWFVMRAIIFKNKQEILRCDTVRVENSNPITVGHSPAPPILLTPQLCFHSK